MKIVTECTVALAFVTAGCLPGSIHPLYESSADLVSVPDLPGIWVGEDSGEHLVVRQEEDRHYELVLIEDDDEPTADRLDVRLVRCGPSLFWDLSVPHPPGDVFGAHLLPLHTFARVEVGDGSLEVAGLNEEWWRASLAAGSVRLGFEEIEDRLVLTSAPQELCSELGRHADDPAAFGPPDRFRLLR
jgi:hypothetical protein